jgi:hypothetical protein
MEARPQIAEIFRDIRMSHAAANEESSKKDVIFAKEIEETVQAITQKTGIQLAGFVEYF